MNVSGFNRIRKSLQDAENRRIAHLNELAFRTRPTWDEIERGFRLGNEFREIHAAALDSFAAHLSESRILRPSPWSFYIFQRLF